MKTKAKILIMFFMMPLFIYGANPIYTGNFPKIFGLEFGCSYERAKSVMESKYGNPDSYFTDTNQITYKSISYGGFFWETVCLRFQYDGYRSYLNRIIFCSNSSKDTKHIIKVRDDIYSVLCQTYPDSFSENKDAQGFKYYYGGPKVYITTDIESMIKGVNNENLSPLGISLIAIDIVHYHDGSHSARLDYGEIPFEEEKF